MQRSGAWAQPRMQGGHLIGGVGLLIGIIALASRPVHLGIGSLAVIVCRGQAGPDRGNPSGWWGRWRGWPRGSTRLVQLHVIVWIHCSCAPEAIGRVCSTMQELFWREAVYARLAWYAGSGLKMHLNIGSPAEWNIHHQ